MQKMTPSLPRKSLLLSSKIIGMTLSLMMLQACSSLEKRVAAERLTPPLNIATAAPTRAALVAAAKAEWTFFGEQQIDMRQSILSAPRLGLLEDEGEAVQRIALYWRAVDKDLNGADRDQAWSAAFISYLMVVTNVSAYDFTPDDVHFSYLSYLKQRQSQANPAFELRPAATTPIAPGDLICAPRGTNAATTVDDIRPSLAGHCDMVIEVHREEGWASVIGGNVFNSVSASMIPIDSEAHAIPIAMRPWFVVAKNLLP